MMTPAARTTPSVVYWTFAIRDEDLDPLLEDDVDAAEDGHQAEPVDRQPDELAERTASGRSGGPGRSTVCSPSVVRSAIDGGLLGGAGR